MAKGVKQIAMNLSGGGYLRHSRGEYIVQASTIRYPRRNRTNYIFHFLQYATNSIQSPIGGGNNNNLQPQQSGAMQHPPTKDHAAQDSIFSNMRQIGFNKPKNGGGYFSVRDRPLPQGWLERYSQCKSDTPLRDTCDR